MTPLRHILSFLDAYHPADPDKASTISALLERAKRQPDRKLICQMASELHQAPFVLRNSTVKPLPGLVQKLRQHCQAATH